MTYGKDFQDKDLIIALSSLQQICSNQLGAHDGKQFYDFYTKTIETIEAYAAQKPSRYFQEKLIELPIMSQIQIASY